MLGSMQDWPLVVTSILDHAAHFHGEREVVSRSVEGPIVRTNYRQIHGRARQVAKALTRRGIRLGDRIGTLAWNTGRHVEAWYGIMGLGAICHTINPRLFPEQIVYIVNHAEDRMIFVDLTFVPLLEKIAKQIDGVEAFVVLTDKANMPKTTLRNAIAFEDLIGDVDDDFKWAKFDENTAAGLCYTSGTTGNPKGVVYHHRGAYLNALSNIIDWGMPRHSVYLWTLPMFHCNGWCFAWTMAANAGTNVCLRRVEAKAIFDAIRDHGVTHYCGAPIVHSMLVNAGDEMRRGISHKVSALVAAAAPPAAMIEGMERIGFDITHVYGLTETYGPAAVCAKHDDWATLDIGERTERNGRQGVRYTAEEGMTVMDPQTMREVPWDGETMGEIMFRGNVTMKGYLKNPAATREAFAGGWFHTGDLAVIQPDGYVKIKDRSKDVIISGGENVSSLEVEDALYRHPAVVAVAVVAQPDPKWGETPCAFVELKPGAQATESELIEHCRGLLARFKAPKKVIFGEIPRTSTGKIQKFLLRERAKSTAAIE
jgi:fatty-acyl-CoA synthase